MAVMWRHVATNRKTLVPDCCADIEALLIKHTVIANRLLKLTLRNKSAQLD